MAAISLRLSALIMSIISTAPVTTADNALELDDILAGVHYSESLVQNVRVDYSYNVSQVLSPREISQRTKLSPEISLGPLPRETSHQYGKEGGKIFYSRKRLLENDTRSSEWMAWDGEKARTYNAAGQIGGLSLQPERIYTYVDTDTPLHFGGYLDATGKCLSQVLEEGDVTLRPEKEDIDGHSCYVVNVADHSGVDRTLWIDVTRGYRPLRIEIKNRGCLMLVYDNVQLEMISQDIWMATSATCHAYLPASGKQGDLFTVKECKVTKTEVNIDLPDTYFAPDFPSGTKVYDEAAQTFYYVGAPPLDEETIDALLENLTEMNRPMSKDTVLGKTSEESKGRVKIPNKNKDSAEGNASANVKRYLPTDKGIVIGILVVGVVFIWLFIRIMRKGSRK